MCRAGGAVGRWTLLQHNRRVLRVGGAVAGDCGCAWRLEDRACGARPREPSSLPNVTLPPLGSRLPAPSAAARGSSSAAPPRARASARLDGVARPQYNDDAPPETKRDVRRDGAAPARKKRRIGEHSADADAHVRHELCAVEADADLLRVRLFTLGDVALFAGRFVDVDGLQLQVSTRRGQAEPVSSTQTILLPLPLADAQVVDKSYENGVWTLSFKLALLVLTDQLPKLSARADATT